MKILTVSALALGVGLSSAVLAGSGETMLGAGVGGALGAVVGEQVGGQTGAIVGAGVGAAAGAALTTDGNDGRRVVVREPAYYGPHDNGLHCGHHKHKHHHD
ncbi:MAG: YMGG-like glycine zipper-containing protein [Pseudomonadota bacterium]